MSVDDTVTYWADHNNISSAPSTSSYQDSGDTIEHSIYSGGDNGSRVEYYKIVGGGHDWFGNDFNGQNLNGFDLGICLSARSQWGTLASVNPAERRRGKCIVQGDGNSSAKSMTP